MMWKMRSAKLRLRRPLPLVSSKHHIAEQYAGSNGKVLLLMGLYLLKLLLWCPIAVTSDQLPVTSEQGRQGAGELGSLGEEKQGSNSELNSPLHLRTSAPLPCLDSSNECVNELTTRAIAHSNKLKKLDEKIALIDERLELMEDRIAYSQKKTWTNYVLKGVQPL